MTLRRLASPPSVLWVPEALKATDADVANASPINRRAGGMVDTSRAPRSTVDALAELKPTTQSDRDELVDPVLSGLADGIAPDLLLEEMGLAISASPSFQAMNCSSWLRVSIGAGCRDG